ncbi:MAG: efflux RND transporter periplasmic adaptor subunit [Aliarcobacter sp.]|nr:efflux RND transporter periplasmic adaptor subunit [Aliarcobacter sp.]
MYYKLLSTVLLLVIIFTGCEKKQEKVEEKASVKIVKIFDLKNVENLSKSFSYPAEIYAFQDVSMAFEVNGKIVDFYYKEGENVKKGSVIAKLDDAIYKANYNSAEANYNQALRDYKRFEKLLQSKSVAEIDFEMKKQNLQVTKSSMQIAKKNLEETKLIAEFDGIIAKKIVDDFARITAKQAIVRLQDNSSYKIKFFVPENEIQELKGDLTPAYISNIIDFYITFGNDKNKKYEAKLIDISTTAEKVTRTFEATLQMQTQDNITILPGMTAKVNAIVKEQNKERIFIPYSAIFSDNAKKSFVWAINKDNKVYKQEVNLGEISKDFVEITAGLDSVSKIVTSGIRFLESNDEVKEYEKIGN